MRIPLYIPFIVIACVHGYKQIFIAIEEQALIAVAHAGYQLAGLPINRIIEDPELVAISAIITAHYLRLERSIDPFGGHDLFSIVPAPVITQHAKLEHIPWA